MAALKWWNITSRREIIWISEHQSATHEEIGEKKTLRQYTLTDRKCFQFLHRRIHHRQASIFALSDSFKTFSHKSPWAHMIVRISLSFFIESYKIQHKSWTALNESLNRSNVMKWWKTWENCIELICNIQRIYIYKNQINSSLYVMCFSVCSQLQMSEYLNRWHGNYALVGKFVAV